MLGLLTGIFAALFAYVMLGLLTGIFAALFALRDARSADRRLRRHLRRRVELRTRWRGDRCRLIAGVFCA
jgi:hypothetical protein